MLNIDISLIEKALINGKEIQIKPCKDGYIVLEVSRKEIQRISK